MSIYKTPLCLLLALLLASALPCAAAGENPGILRVKCFKNGKADAFLLRTEHHAVLIDTGETDDAQGIIAYLGEKGISALDLLILSHFDKRNIGGAREILEKVPVRQILIPDYEKVSVLSFLVLDKLASLPARKVTQRLALSFDRVRLLVLPARKDRYEEDGDNDFSLVVSVSHGANSFFFAGDIMSERIGEMGLAGELTPHTVIKLPNFGQNTEGLNELLDAVRPQIALISASIKNPPAGAVLADLEGRGIRWYATMHGSINLTSDGYQVTIEQNRQ